MSVVTPEDVLAFWFADETRSKWFASTPEFDALVRDRFEATWQSAVRGELDHWQTTADGTLALAIVLDQFPRNMYRGEARAFASGDQAIALTRHAIRQGIDQQIDHSRLAFLYLPLMHSEDPADQDQSVQLFEAAGLETNLRFARHHRDIVRRFGRFPHRNAMLGRASTDDELSYLSSKEAFKG